MALGSIRTLPNLSGGIDMSRCLITLCLLTVLATSIAVAEELPWLDLQNCAMCKPLTAEKGLMENMDWAQYNISGGFVAMTTVNGEYIDAYRTAHEGMNATVARLQGGEHLELCGSCMAIGTCMMKGATQDYVQTPTGDLWIVTATDPELVAELQAWVKRNKEEMEKMKAAKG